MKPEIKAKWVEALRSGNYAQGRAQLRDGNSFCCLGVLCDLVKEQVGGRWEESYFVIGTHYDIALLPDEIINVCGLPDDDPKVGERHCSALNDTGKSFPEIADLIEKHL